MQGRETDGDKERDEHKDVELEMIDDLYCFFSLQRRKQSARSVWELILTVHFKHFWEKV